MEEKKNLEPEEKKTAKSEETTRSTVKKKTTTSDTTRKTSTKKSTSTDEKEIVKKETPETEKEIAETKSKQTNVSNKEEENVEVQPKTKQPESKANPKIERKKKHVFLKTILILIGIALVLLLIHFERNYIIINDILEKQKELIKATNYSYTTKHDNVTMEFYHKDNKLIIVKNNDAGKVMIWSDLDRKETIFLNMKELNATIENNSVPESFFKLIPRGIILNTEESRNADFLYWITSETVNGKDCYKVTWLMGGDTAWYDKETGVMVKLVQSEGSYVMEYTDWKINMLTDDEMTRPNLIGYQINEKE